ncbi:MAG: glycosyltransferase family 1 protein, partial [bacterium]
LWSPGYTAPLRVACPQVTSVLDMQYKTHPEDLTALARWTTDILVRRATLNSRRVLTISEFSKTEITKYTGIAPENVVVAPLAADGLAAALPSESEARETVAGLLGDRRKYILAVSNTYPHKNLEAAVEAFGCLENTIPHKLVVVGQPRLGEKMFRAAVSKLSDPSRVQRYNHLERETLAALYVAADVFVFPSLYEGFGLPVLEAMVAGVPVVTGRFGSIPEVGGDTCVYVDSRSPELLAAGIGDVLGWGAETRKRHVEQARRHAGSFSWKRTAGRTLAALIAAAGKM